MTVDVEAARQFLRAHGRIIETRLAEFAIDGVVAGAWGAIAGIEAYRNPDGGLGHGLEPDALVPGSQPLAVDSAFDIYRDIAESTTDQGLRQRVAQAAADTMDYLEAVAAPDGGLSIVLPPVAEFPRAEHWGDGNFPPGLNPTAKVLGNARTLGLAHPWMERAATFCRTAIFDSAPVADAHTAVCVLRFLETELDHEPSRRRYEELLRRSGELAWFKSMPGPDYGLTPLDFAPSPASPRYRFFDAEAIERHLDALASAQLDDGGWPVSWTPPSPGSLLAWRGMVTLEALRILRAYGQI